MKKVKIELHLIQNFAPSCLNRDDTNTPKDCEFGGVRRARISSQCIKRSIRKEAHFAKLLAAQGGVRTRRLIVEIAERFSGKQPAPEDVVKVVSEVFKQAGIERPETPKGQGAEQDKTAREVEKDNTKLILFMDETALDEMTGYFREHWDGLKTEDKEKRGKAVDALGRVLAGAVRAPDVALFGRMIEVKSSTPFGKLQLNVDAACQVAHAISTHRVEMEFDFYTAIDDLLPKGDTGASMMGVTGFNSACFYRYALVDREQLATNLDGEGAADPVIQAFLEAAIHAIPTGKQNSMAAQNWPSFGMIVVRDAGSPCSLANAFARPITVSAGDEEDLVGASIAALDRHWNELQEVYGSEGIVDKAVFSVGHAERLSSLTPFRKSSAKKAIQAAMDAVAGCAEAAP